MNVIKAKKSCCFNVSLGFWNIQDFQIKKKKRKKNIWFTASFLHTSYFFIPVVWLRLESHVLLFNCKRGQAYFFCRDVRFSLKFKFRPQRASLVKSFHNVFGNPKYTSDLSRYHNLCQSEYNNFKFFAELGDSYKLQ